MLNLLKRLFRKMTIEELRIEAIQAVRECPDRYLAATSKDAPGEGSLTADGYLHVIEHPAEYFMCSACVESGPWHRTWAGEGLRRRKRIGPCCTGAD